jgi:hypothetical protein
MLFVKSQPAVASAPTIETGYYSGAASFTCGSETNSYNFEEPAPQLPKRLMAGAERPQKFNRG